jgi:hypothetical protein
VVLGGLFRRVEEVVGREENVEEAVPGREVGGGRAVAGLELLSRRLSARS